MFGFGRLGPMELILILVIALVIFGPKKLPEIGRAVGKAIREFKQSTSRIAEDLDIDDNARKPASREIPGSAGGTKKEA